MLLAVITADITTQARSTVAQTQCHMSAQMASRVPDVMTVPTRSNKILLRSRVGAKKLWTRILSVSTFFWNSFFFKLSDYSKFNTFSKQLNNTVSAVNSTPMDTPPLTSVLNPSKLLLLNRGHEVAQAAAATLTIVCHPSLRSDGVKSPLEHANGESFNPCACLWPKPVKIEWKRVKTDILQGWAIHQQLRWSTQEKHCCQAHPQGLQSVGLSWQVESLSTSPNRSLPLLKKWILITDLPFCQI